MANLTTCDRCGLSGNTMEVSVGNRNESLCTACKSLLNLNKPIAISPMQYDDLELVLAWRSNPKIYQYARHQNEPLVWDEHVSWFKSRNDNRCDFIIHYEGRRVGVVGITEEDEVTIYLGEFGARGDGVGTIAVNWLCRRFSHRSPFFAEVHESNDASKTLFRRCGFELEDSENQWLYFSYSGD